MQRFGCKNEIMKRGDVVENSTYWSVNVEDVLEFWVLENRIKVIEVFNSGWGSVAARVELFDGSKAVVKSPYKSEFAVCEVSWLSAVGDGICAPRLLDYCLVDGIDILLIEDVFPGEVFAPLHIETELDRNRCSELLYKLRERMQSVVSSDVLVETFDFAQHVQKRLKTRPEGDRAIFELVKDAELWKEQNQLEAKELLATSPCFLLHGDLHSANILSSNQVRWGAMVIDPMPVFGDPAFDVAFLLCASCPAELNTEALHDFSKAYKAEPSRVLGWSRILAYNFLEALVILFPERVKEISNLKSLKNSLDRM